MIPGIVEALIDLHTHSHYSDGTLPPAEVVRLAMARGVGLLALTDHDTTAGLAEAHAAASGTPLRLIDGAEITTGWRGQELHIVALGIDVGDAPLQAHLATLLQMRRERMAAIGARLARQRHFGGRDPAEAVLASAHVPTRTHLARALVAAGDARNTQDAFDRWLGRGRAGHVPQQWPAMETAIEVIRAGEDPSVFPDMTERVKDLLAYSVSLEYQTVRERLRIAI